MLTFTPNNLIKTFPIVYTLSYFLAMFVAELENFVLPLKDLEWKEKLGDVPQG